MNPHIDVEQVKDWARQAGQIALKHFQNPKVEFKQDRTMVTQADHEIEALLSQAVRAAYPDHALIGEEGNRIGNINAETLWAIDPIDGTRAFSQGLSNWGISIGVLHQGEPYFGLIYMPLVNDWTYTDANGHIVHNDRLLDNSLRQEWDDQSFLAISSNTHWHYHILFKCTRIFGALSANLVYLARGSALGIMLERGSIWDVAAGAAILIPLGAEFCYLSGQPVDWGELRDGHPFPEPIVAAHPNLLPRVRASFVKRTHPPDYGL